MTPKSRAFVRRFFQRTGSSCSIARGMPWKQCKLVFFLFQFYNEKDHNVSLLARERHSLETTNRLPLILTDILWHILFLLKTQKRLKG